jgi:hypothetical protein
MLVVERDVSQGVRAWCASQVTEFARVQDVRREGREHLATLKNPKVMAPNYYFARHPNG